MAVSYLMQLEFLKNNYVKQLRVQYVRLTSTLTLVLLSLQQYAKCLLKTQENSTHVSTVDLHVT